MGFWAGAPLGAACGGCAGAAGPSRSPATGASGFSVAAYATVPQALGPLAVHSLFRLEWNSRQATVVGMIGAGGIGQALFQAQQLFFYRRMMAYLLITWFIVLAVDLISDRLRRRIGRRRLALAEILQ